MTKTGPPAVQRTYGLSLARALPAKLQAMGVQRMPRTLLPPPRAAQRVDLRRSERMPPIYDQGQIGSCTANALCAVMQYLRPSLQGSRLFLYYNERVLEADVEMDAGATITDGVRSLLTAGLCSEREWPYVPVLFAKKPPDECYASARKHEATAVAPVPVALQSFKNALLAGHPVAIGIAVYDSFESRQVALTGVVPMPGPSERLLGGHAVVVVGFDDATQRFTVRNSWGASWGQGGYFTIPYAYLSSRLLTSDAWVITACD